MGWMPQLTTMKLSDPEHCRIDKTGTEEAGRGPPDPALTVAAHHTASGAVTTWDSSASS